MIGQIRITTAGSAFINQRAARRNFSLAANLFNRVHVPAECSIIVLFPLVSSFFFLCIFLSFSFSFLLFLFSSSSSSSSSLSPPPPSLSLLHPDFELLLGKIRSQNDCNDILITFKFISYVSRFLVGFIDYSKFFR